MCIVTVHINVFPRPFQIIVLILTLPLNLIPIAGQVTFPFLVDRVDDLHEGLADEELISTHAPKKNDVILDPLRHD